MSCLIVGAKSHCSGAIVQLLRNRQFRARHSDSDSKMPASTWALWNYSVIQPYVHCYPGTAHFSGRKAHGALHPYAPFFPDIQGRPANKNEILTLSKREL